MKRLCIILFFVLLPSSIISYNPIGDNHQDIVQIKLELYNEFGEFIDPNDYGSGSPINIRAKYSCPDTGGQLWDTDFTIYPGNQGTAFTDLYKCRNGLLPALAFFKATQRNTEFEIIRQYTISKIHYQLFIRLETPPPPPVPFSREYYRKMFTIDADISILPTEHNPARITAENSLWKGNERQFWLDWRSSFSRKRQTTYRDEQKWNEELSYYNDFKVRHPNECFVVYGWRGDGITLSGNTSLWWCMYWDPYGILTVEFFTGGRFSNRPPVCSQYDYLKKEKKSFTEDFQKKQKEEREDLKEPETKQEKKEEIKEEQIEKNIEDKIIKEQEVKKDIDDQTKNELTESDYNVGEVIKYFAGHIEINLGENDGIRSGIKIGIFSKEEENKKIAEGYIITVYKDKSVVKLTAQFGKRNPMAGDVVDIINFETDT